MSKLSKTFVTLIVTVVSMFTFSAVGHSGTQTSKTLIVKCHHSNDVNTVIRIWKTSDNKYIIRSNHGNDPDDFDQSVIYQYNKTVKYDGFAKRVTFQVSDTYYILAHVSGEYALVFGFFSEALNTVVSANYIVDYINKEAFNDL